MPVAAVMIRDPFNKSRIAEAVLKKDTCIIV